MSSKNLKIALFLGGTSPEREVSKSSGKAIYKAIISLGYSCKLIDPGYGKNQPTTEEDFFTQNDFTEIGNENIIETVNSDLLNETDLVFNALHGKWGEDGAVQTLLELRKIPYSGSGIFSSMVAMDKTISKTLFKLNGVNTATWLSIDNSYKYNDLLEQVNSKFGFPCVVKPNDQGSTVGLTIARDESELQNAVEQAFNFSTLVLIEEFIPGKEMTVAILENEALPVLEIVPKSGFYDYTSKYTSGMSEYFVPADIPNTVFDQLQQQALTAFNCLRCEVYGRVDFRLNEENIPFCLEVNTLPGMTETSLVPKMAAADGISFEELINRIIKASLDGKK